MLAVLPALPVLAVLAQAVSRIRLAVVVVLVEAQVVVEAVARRRS